MNKKVTNIFFFIGIIDKGFVYLAKAFDWNSIGNKGIV